MNKGCRFGLPNKYSQPREILLSINSLGGFFDFDLLKIMLKKAGICSRLQGNNINWDACVSFRRGFNAMKDLILMGESSTIEFKTEDVHNNSIAKEVAAFANFLGGKLLVGVGDDGRVTGVSDRKIEQRIVQICRNNIIPSLIPQVEFAEVEGKTILVVTIPKGSSKPYKVRTTGKFYIRAGSSSVEPTNEELARFFQNGELIHYEIKPVHGASIKDLNKGYLNQYLREFRGIDENFETEEEFLQALYNLNLLTRINGEYAPTIAGMILFGNNPKKFLPQSIAQAVCFSGEDESSDIIEMKESAGSVTEVMEGLLRFAERNSRTKVDFQAGIKRKDMEQYPATIVRELIANAIAHRDYSVWGACNRLYIFADRLEMRSPGRLPNTITIESMKMGVSYHRNPIIIQTLKDYGYVEKIGRGIIKCNRKLRDFARRELEILELEEEIRVVLYAE